LVELNDAVPRNVKRSLFYTLIFRIFIVFARFCLLSISLAAIAPFVGCDVSTQVAKDGHDHDHDHGHAHDHASNRSLAEALKALEAYQVTIKTAFEADKPDDAHGALHDVAHTIEEMEATAQKVLTTDEAKLTAKNTLKSLFDAYGALDEVMHGGTGKKYVDVAKQIEESFDALRKMIPAEPAATGNP
jgi:hypothetical protein